MIRRISTWLVVLGLLSAALESVPAQQKRIDLNTATATELETLPGIGPALAGRIVDFREENGPFKRIEELMNVQGIGEKKFLKLEKLITVGEGSRRPAKPVEPGHKPSP